MGEELSVIDDVTTLDPVVNALNAGDTEQAAPLSEAWVIEDLAQSHNQGFVLTLEPDSCAIHPSFEGRTCFVVSTSGEGFNVHMTPVDCSWRATSYEVLGELSPPPDPGPA